MFLVTVDQCDFPSWIVTVRYRQAFTVSMHLGRKNHSLAPSTRCSCCVGALEIVCAKLPVYVVHLPSTSNSKKWFDSIPSTVCREPWKPQDVLLLVDHLPWPKVVKLPSLSLCPGRSVTRSCPHLIIGVTWRCWATGWLLPQLSAETSTNDLAMKP